MPPSPESLLQFVDFVGLIRLATEWYLAIVLGVFAFLLLAAAADRWAGGVPARGRRRARAAAAPAHQLRLPHGGHPH